MYEDPPKKQSRQALAKKYNKQTVIKLFSHLKTTNIVVSGVLWRNSIELRVNWKQYKHLSFLKNYPENVQFYALTPWIRVLMTWIRQDGRADELRREDHRFQMQLQMIMVMMKPRVIAPARSLSRLSPSLKAAKFTVSLMDKQ